MSVAPVSWFCGNPVAPSDVSKICSVGGSRLMRYIRLPSAENCRARVSLEPPAFAPIELRKNQLPVRRNGGASLTGRPTVNIWIRSSLRLPT